MGIISVDKVSPGMVLADKVITSKRMMLLPAGVTITEGHLGTFKTWGITEVNIVGEAEEGDEVSELTEEELEALKAEIGKIFKFNKLEAPFTKALFNIACKNPRSSS